MDHIHDRHRQCHPNQPHHLSYSSHARDVNSNAHPLPSQPWYPFGLANPNSSQEGRNNNGTRSFEEWKSPAKRHRDHHVIVASSQDYDYNDCRGRDHDFNCNEAEMMDCDNDFPSPSKRRRIVNAAPFDNDGRIIQQHQQQINHHTNVSALVRDYRDSNLLPKDEEVPSVEWWRKKRPPATNLPAAIGSRSIVEQEASSSCAAMDTSFGGGELRCHICRNSFPTPIVPSVREVMPANALLNYFSPLNKKLPLKGDVDMATNNTNHHRASAIAGNPDNCVKSPACCQCCDRPSCPECRRECQACQKSFCCFCSVSRDDVMGQRSDSCFCLDCHDN